MVQMSSVYIISISVYMYIHVYVPFLVVSKLTSYYIFSNLHLYLFFRSLKCLQFLPKVREKEMIFLSSHGCMGRNKIFQSVSRSMMADGDDLLSNISNIFIFYIFLIISRSESGPITNHIVESIICE